jgi:DNA ligase-1
VRRFAELYARLDATTSTTAKVEALRDYFVGAPDADGAWAVHFLAGGKIPRVVPAAVLRELAQRAAGIPVWMFDECYQAAGDLAETIAHLLPEPGAGSDRPLSEWVTGRLLPLRTASPSVREQELLAAWAELDERGRFVWNKLITGGFRVGVSKLLVTRGLGLAAGLDPRLLAERLVGGWTPTAESYRALLAPETVTDRAGRPYPFFLAHPLDVPAVQLGPREAWHAEWKWDGIRAQIVRRAGQVHVWSRGDELVTDRFPEAVEIGSRLPDGAVIDGELLAWQDGAPLPFSMLQRRIGLRRLTARALAQAPAALMAYDLLELRGEDIRAQPFHVRRARLEVLVADVGHPRLLLSPSLEAADWSALAMLRAQSRSRGVEGLMLKRLDSPYGAGRVKLGAGGEWWTWKVDPHSVDAVLVYAQRGHGRRASLYTDYTFAVWRGDELVPFAKAYSGLTDAEIRDVDAFIRRHTREKFGPVRSVAPGLVMEIGFEGIGRSARHRSGVAVRFPRILRLRPDKTPVEADRIETLLGLIDAGGE